MGFPRLSDNDICSPETGLPLLVSEAGMDIIAYQAGLIFSEGGRECS